MDFDSTTTRGGMEPVWMYMAPTKQAIIATASPISRTSERSGSWSDMRGPQPYRFTPRLSRKAFHCFKMASAQRFGGFNTFGFAPTQFGVDWISLISSSKVT